MTTLTTNERAATMRGPAVRSALVEAEARALSLADEATS